ncbi:MAG: hypothetical protein SGILL_005988 [Bacillariaceae sp.]
MSDHNEEKVEEERHDTLPQGTQQSAAWEWNSHLARVYRKEAERSFQRRVVNQASASAARAKESATISDNSATDIEAGGGSPTTHDDGQHDDDHNDFSYCRLHRNVLPPHRPRNNPEEYRLSALEYDHDVALIPPTDPQDIALALPAALERERIFEQGVFPLLCKRIWKYKGLDYSKEHPMAGFAGTMDTVAPDSWAEDEDEKGTPWPHGTPYDAEAFVLCWHFFLFVFDKFGRESIKIIFCQIVVSLVSPACSYLFGSGLLDELNEDTSKGETEKQRSIRSFAYVLSICVLNIFAGYLTVYYKNAIPVGGVRTNLRDVLFRRMQNLQSPLKDKLTPGAASGLIVDQGHYSFLTFPSLVTGILAHIVVSISSLVKIHYSHLVGIAIVTIFAAYAVIAGQGITVGNFATLISSITSILTLSSTVGSFFTGLYDNHMMLKQISCVMNDDDITFGGGTDHFKIVNKLRLSSAALKLKHPRQHSSSNNDKEA